MELGKQSAWSDTQSRIFDFSTQTGPEVDLVMENAAGRVFGVEVKSSATVGSRDFRGLRALAKASGDRFLCGIVLYTGKAAVPFGDTLHALLVSSLWNTTAS